MLANVMWVGLIVKVIARAKMHNKKISWPMDSMWWTSEKSQTMKISNE